MNFSNYMARQFGNPEGFVGKLFMGPYLDYINRKGNALVYDALRFNPSSRMLEVGFGGGDLLFRVAQSLQDGSIDGVELSAAMLQRASKKSRKKNLESMIRFKSATVEDLPFDNAVFDCAYTVNTLYFWQDLPAGLNELARVIRPEGELVLGFGSAKALRESGYEDRGFRLYDADQITDTCEQCGFITDKLDKIERGRQGDFFAYRGIKSA